MLISSAERPWLPGGGASRSASLHSNSYRYKYDTRGVGCTGILVIEMWVTDIEIW